MGVWDDERPFDYPGSSQGAVYTPLLEDDMTTLDLDPEQVVLLRDILTSAFYEDPSPHSKDDILALMGQLTEI